METIALRTKRTIDELLAGVDSGRHEVFLKEQNSRGRNSACVALAIQLSEQTNLGVDLRVKVEVGRRPKRVDLVAIGSDVLILCNVSGEGGPLSEASRLSELLDPVKLAATKSGRDVRVYGYVVDVSKSKAPTPAQIARYEKEGIHIGSTLEFWEWLET